jgi:hypothetical protein
MVAQLHPPWHQSDYRNPHHLCCDPDVPVRAQISAPPVLRSLVRRRMRRGETKLQFDNSSYFIIESRRC